MLSDPGTATGAGSSDAVPPRAPRPSSARIRGFMVCGTRFDVDERYTLQKPLGAGAYGIVCSAVDSKTGGRVAIKKISRAFDCLLNTKRTLRELRLMRHFDHENVLSLVDVLMPISPSAFDDLYLVTELMDTDLHQVIVSTQPLTHDHCQYFLYQLLRALKYIHSAHVLHRDLKPSNLLLNSCCDLRVCDFGLARVADPDRNRAGFMTEYVATRWYRAPEALDVWSVGAIFAELLGRKPLFPGKDYVHQLNLIFEVVGSPEEADIASIESAMARRYVLSLPQRKGVPLERLFPSASPAALDLLRGLLAFSPAKRLTVDEAIAHPYLASLHDPSDEPVAESFEWEREWEATEGREGREGQEWDAGKGGEGGEGLAPDSIAALKQHVAREVLTCGTQRWQGREEGLALRLLRCEQVLAFHPEVTEADRQDFLRDLAAADAAAEFEAGKKGGASR